MSEVGSAEYWHERFSRCLAMLEETQAQLRASEAEVARLTRELEDVRKLDAHQGAWVVAPHYPGDPKRAYSCMALNGPVGRPFLAGSPQEARRAAVEYLEKERKDV